MDILYFVQEFPKLSESFIINEIYELNSRGQNVSVFSIDEPEDEISHSEFDDLDISIQCAEKPSITSLPELVSREVLHPRVLRQATFLEHPISHALWLHLGKQVSELIKQLDGVDVIHAHFASQNRLAVTYAAAYHSIPCTVTAHAYEIFTNNARQVNRVCSRFDQVVVPSQYNQQYLRNQVGVNTNISVVPATTNVSKFEPSDDCISGRLLTVARLVEKKGHKYAIDAIAELVKQGYDIEYHIIGEGEREEFLRERVRKHEIEEYVEFLGHVSDERLMDELHMAELFVLPCIITADGNRDITPVALREAMATKTACISTTISAIPEVITNGHDGLLVEPRSSEALAESIARLLDDSERRKELAQNARKTVETKFDISKSVDQLEEIFKSVQ